MEIIKQQKMFVWMHKINTMALLVFKIVLISRLIALSGYKKTWQQFNFIGSGFRVIHSNQ